MIIQDLDDEKVFALTLYGEARGEPIEGQISVANVIMNRFLDNSHEYKSIKDVCLKPFQFSCWNINDPNRDLLLKKAIEIDYTNDPILKQCKWIVEGIINREIIDNTKDAHYYMVTSEFKNDPPSWVKNPNDIMEVGKHTFFNV